jgi:hypothetical protein
LALWAYTFKELILSGRHTVRTVTPLLYVAGFVPVFLGVFLSVALLENNLWLSELTGLYYVGDLVAVVAMLLIGGLVFGPLSAVILRLDNLRRPTFLDHLRHCALIYASLFLLLFVLVVSYELQAGGLGYGLGIVVFVIGAYAAFIDASILFLNRRLLNRAEHGGAR